MPVQYVSGYKYQLRSNVYVRTDLRPAVTAAAPLVTLYPDGDLIIEKYFAWDGPSGPTPDFKCDMKAALVHDALYYLIRMGALDISFKQAADAELYRTMVEDGVSGWILEVLNVMRARLYRWVVTKFGGFALKSRKIHFLS